MQKKPSGIYFAQMHFQGGLVVATFHASLVSWRWRGGSSLKIWEAVDMAGGSSNLGGGGCGRRKSPLERDAAVLP